MPARARMSMVVTRADGTVEDHGIISESDIPQAVLDELVAGG
jgi:hypothetical protein